MPDIFDEVEEDLRADQLRKLLLRYGGLLVAAAVLVVVAVGGWQAWTWYGGRRALAVAQIYLDAVKIADQHPGPGLQAAIPGLIKVEEAGSAGYRTLARLRHAALLAEAGNLPGAAALWDAVAADSSADPILRDLANLQWAQHEVDGGDPALVASRLQPLARPDNPWHGLAQETQALLALRQGRTDAARDLLKPLTADPGSTDDVRRLAAGLLAQLAAANPNVSGTSGPRANGS